MYLLVYFENTTQSNQIWIEGFEKLYIISFKIRIFYNIYIHLYDKSVLMQGILRKLQLSKP